jgi:hypothetical protein
VSSRSRQRKGHEEKNQIETAVCFPTGSGSVVRLQEVPFQIAWRALATIERLNRLNCSLASTRVR